MSYISYAFPFHPGDELFDGQDIHPRRSSNYRRLPWSVLRRTNLGLQSEIREDGPNTFHRYLHSQSTLSLAPAK